MDSFSIDDLVSLTIALLKKGKHMDVAEEALPKAHDVRMSYQTYEALATLNYYSGNDSLAMDYSYKTLACAEQSGNHHQMTYACNHLLVLYMARQDLHHIGNLHLGLYQH